MNEGKKNVYLPDDLYRLLAKKAKESGAATTDNFIAELLRHFLKEDKGPSRKQSREEVEIKKKLKDLGYLS